MERVIHLLLKMIMPSRRSSQKGGVLVITCFLVIPLLGIAVLAVDLFLAYSVRTEMANAADFAALASIKKLANATTLSPSVLADIRDTAKVTALENETRNKPGTGIILDTGDIIFGMYDHNTRVFTPYSDTQALNPGNPVNAVEVTVRLDNTDNDAFMFKLAQIFGHKEKELAIRSIATYGLLNMVIALDISASMDNRSYRPVPIEPHKDPYNCLYAASDSGAAGMNNYINCGDNAPHRWFREFRVAATAVSSLDSSYPLVPWTYTHEFNPNVEITMPPTPPNLNYCRDQGQGPGNSPLIPPAGTSYTTTPIFGIDDPSDPLIVDGIDTNEDKAIALPYNVVMPQPITDIFETTRDDLLSGPLFNNSYRCGLLTYNAWAFAPYDPTPVPWNPFPGIPALSGKLTSLSLNNKTDIQEILTNTLHMWKVFADLDKGKSDTAERNLFLDTYYNVLLTATDTLAFAFPGGFHGDKPAFTNIGDAIFRASTWIGQVNDATHTRGADVIILLTDGSPNCHRVPLGNPDNVEDWGPATARCGNKPGDYTQGEIWSRNNAKRAHNQGIVIHAIYFATDPNEGCPNPLSDPGPDGFELLRDITNLTNGNLYCAKDISTLAAIFQDIASERYFTLVPSLGGGSSSDY